MSAYFIDYKILAKQNKSKDIKQKDDDGNGED